MKLGLQFVTFLSLGFHGIIVMYLCEFDSKLGAIESYLMYLGTSILFGL